MQGKEKVQQRLQEVAIRTIGACVPLPVLFVIGYSTSHFNPLACFYVTNAWAAARPMPEAAPVTSTTLPVKSRMFFMVLNLPISEDLDYMV